MSPSERPPRSARHVRRAGTRPGLEGRYGLPGQRRSGARSRRGAASSSLSAARTALSGLKLPSVTLKLPGASWRGAAAALIVAAGLLATSYATAVRSVEVSGTKTLAASKVEESAKEALGKQWLGSIVPTVNTGAIERELLAAEPGVKEVSVSRRLPNRITVTVVERSPSLNWKSGGQRFVIDADGTVIGATPPSYDALPTVVDNTNLPVKAGDRVVPATFIIFTSDVTKQLADMKLKPVGFSVPQTTTELYVKTDKNYTIKFDTTRPAADSGKDLAAVLKQLGALKKTPAEYIDLRVPNKAYYR